VEYLITESSEEGFVPWSLERGCSPKCHDFCVTMGARTKVTYCTSCCTTQLCNTDNGRAATVENSFALFSWILAAATIAINSIAT
jgi:hypothetical protein